jgi:solute:Na+ symporter, SSS family
MKWLDWSVLFATLLLIVAYGTWKSRGARNMGSYLLGDNSLPWWGVCLSVMATQASAVTFLSTPGQAFEDGMGFIQFYFGLPLAMVILSITAVPIYHKLKVFTAYEYLETRFDLKVRTLSAIFFLLLRGLSVGITLYAPSIILSAILGWDITITTIVIGSLVLIYTIAGGSKAVSVTQKYQLSVIMAGMITAGLIAFSKLPEQVSFGNAFQIAGAMGKLNLVDFHFDLTSRYNIWSGLIGGLFLSLSYFGADQSQVGRYLGGKSTKEIRLGLIFNGLLKVPMMFIILYIGVLIFVFYQFQAPPVFHNKPLLEKALSSDQGLEIKNLEGAYQREFTRRKEKMLDLSRSLSLHENTEIVKKEIEDHRKNETVIKTNVRHIIAQAVPGAVTMDKDYVFINFVMTYLPHGLIGLLLAVVFSAAMSSMASELNSLASTTAVDIYKRSLSPGRSEWHYVSATKVFTAAWAVIAIVFAKVAHQSENLIQFVNIIGSLFYGTLLGIFVCAFYIKYVRSTAVFIGAIVAETVILYIYFFHPEVAFLLYNIIGCIVVIVIALLMQRIGNKKAPAGMTGAPS